MVELRSLKVDADKGSRNRRLNSSGSGDSLLAPAVYFSLHPRCDLGAPISRLSAARSRAAPGPQESMAPAPMRVDRDRNGNRTGVDVAHDCIPPGSIPGYRD